MITSFLDMRAKSGPLGFIISSIAIVIVSILAVEGIHMWLHHNHHLSGLIIFLGILVGIIGASIAMARTIRRLNDMQWGGMYSMLIVFPAAAVALIALGVYGPLSIAMIVVGALVLLPLCVVPSKR